MRIADADEAMVRAAASSGVHFSFEKVDRVTRSTICGLFEPGKVAEQVLFRNQLASFALSEAVLAAAREAVSGTEAADSDETAASEGAQQMASSAAMALAAQAAAERERKHIELMAKKERGRQQQEQKAEQKRQKVSQSQ